MAQKAIKDATLISSPYFRLSAMGYAPVEHGDLGDLKEWMERPEEYWSSIDQMFADLNFARVCVIPVFVWNWVQIPAITGESFRDLISNPESKSWRLLEKYVEEFVRRYRDNPGLLFYELTNELNLRVDLDNEGRCAKQGGSVATCRQQSNFTTMQMNQFTARLATLIRRGDNVHKISSGYAIPAVYAHHLTQRPEWSSLGGDWTPDSADEFQANLREIHQFVDIISVHLYSSNSKRLGLTSGTEEKIVGVVKAAAEKIGKPLFIGEFGEFDVRNAGENSFIIKVMAELTKFKVEYSAVWVWELYQMHPDTPYQTAASMYSLEPGYTDTVIHAIGALNARAGRLSPATESEKSLVFPRIVLTEPMECSRVGITTKLFAVAATEGGPTPVVYFYLNGTEVGHVATPPYAITLNSMHGLIGESAEIEARMCGGPKDCKSFKTTVLVKESPGAFERCLALVGPTKTPVSHQNAQ
jgi:hypothetical protein